MYLSVSPVTTITVTLISPIKRPYIKWETISVKFSSKSLLFSLSPLIIYITVGEARQKKLGKASASGSLFLLFCADIRLQLGAQENPSFSLFLSVFVRACIRSFLPLFEDIFFFSLLFFSFIRSLVHSFFLFFVLLLRSLHLSFLLLFRLIIGQFHPVLAT